MCPFMLLTLNMFLDVCQLRLDFETFVTNGPSGTTENVPTSVVGSTVGGGACQDSMVITVKAIYVQYYIYAAFYLTSKVINIICSLSPLFIYVF